MGLSCRDGLSVWTSFGELVVQRSTAGERWKCGSWGVVVWCAQVRQRLGGGRECGDGDGEEAPCSTGRRAAAEVSVSGAVWRAETRRARVRPAGDLRWDASVK